MRKLLLFTLLVGVSMALTSPSKLIKAENDANKLLPEFGRSMRQEFLFHPDFISLDHGAFGTYPKHVQTALHKYQASAESNPDRWIRRDAKIELSKVRLQLAELINALADDIVVIPNTTSGINSILRSIAYSNGDRILHFSTIFSSMLSIIQYLTDSTNGAVKGLEIEMKYPISNNEIVQKLESFLESYQNAEEPIKLALIDHISAFPGAVVPIDRLIPVLKRYNITVLVDGAHAIGHVPIDIQKLEPDYYVTNCHKWLYAARGCSMMYVDKTHQETIHPIIITNEYRRPSNFQQEFYFQGTMDYSNYLTVTAALEFRRSVGGETAIQKYNHELAVQGGDYLASRFGTEVLEDEDQIGNMVDIRLPVDNPEDERITTAFWRDTLIDRFTLYATTYKHNGKWWVRACSQIYNDMTDFEKAAEVFLTICDEVNSNTTSFVVHGWS